MTRSKTLGRLRRARRVRRPAKVNYYEIVPAANGRVCDLRLSGLHTTYEGATIVNRTIHTLPPKQTIMLL